MKKSLQAIAALIVLAATASIATAAESKAVQTMAGILIGLQHMPSTADKTALAQIAEDRASTANEKTLAKALANVQHKVGAGDKAGLDAIVADAKATSGEKSLAGVILGLNHFPSNADKEKLATLSK